MSRDYNLRFKWCKTYDCGFHVVFSWVNWFSFTRRVQVSWKKRRKFLVSIIRLWKEHAFVSSWVLDVTNKPNSIYKTVFTVQWGHLSFRVFCGWINWINQMNYINQSVWMWIILSEYKEIFNWHRIYGNFGNEPYGFSFHILYVVQYNWRKSM